MLLPRHHPRGATPAGTSRGAAHWLGLAAAPTFAIMALLTAFAGSADMPCMALQDVSPINGMALMYLLMSAFHLPPWLKLVARRSGLR
ncbi:MAG TPA: hypothetical protein VFT89_12385 [Rhizobiaceae bacterium]|nr:hypothetical protein [Rhizobiaceae bacterium]